MSLRESPPAARNREPIFEVIDRWLPHGARVLEVASGTGQHVAYFARRRPDTSWQPSDREASGFPSIEGWVRHEGAKNVLAPIVLDVCRGTRPGPVFDAVYCANMIHIAPWSACLGLLGVAADVLPAGGCLLLYGPFLIEGEPTAPSNTAFDADLRRRDPAWGIRDLEVVATEAASRGLRLVDRVAMPANNQLLVFRREATGDGAAGAGAST